MGDGLPVVVVVGAGGVEVLDESGDALGRGTDRVAAAEDARSFDTDGAQYTHGGNKCSFEVRIDDFDLGADLALVRLAQIVHAADIDTELHTDPLAPGLLAIGLGASTSSPTTTPSSTGQPFCMTHSTRGVTSRPAERRDGRAPQL